MYSRIINNLSIVIILLLLISCSGDNSSGWNSAEGRMFSKEFMGTCTEGEVGWDAYCQCGLDWIQREYPNPLNAGTAGSNPAFMEYIMDVCLPKLPY